MSVSSFDARVMSGSFVIFSSVNSIFATLISSDTCPTNSKAQSCHIVEAKLALVTQGGGEGQDNDTVIERAYTAVKLALLALDGGQDRVRLHYLGNNPMSLASKLSKRVDYDISDEDISGIFAVIFVVVSSAVCWRWLPFLSPFCMIEQDAKHIDAIEPQTKT